MWKNWLPSFAVRLLQWNKYDKTIVDETDKIEDDLEQKEEKKVDTNKNEETVVIDGKEVKIYEEVERDIKSNTNNKEQEKQKQKQQDQNQQKKEQSNQNQSGNNRTDNLLESIEKKEQQTLMKINARRNNAKRREHEARGVMTDKPW